MHTPSTEYNAAEVPSAAENTYFVRFRSDGRIAAIRPGTLCWKSIENVIVDRITPKPDHFGAQEIVSEMNGGLLFGLRDRLASSIFTLL